LDVQDLNDLNFFVAVVANGGFSAAARALGIPKSRISRRVAALEAQLGVRLLERSTRRFRITLVGQDIYRHARAAITEAESIVDVAARMQGAPRGLVRISCPPGADRILAAELPLLLARYPDLRVQVIVSTRRIDLIEEGIDVAVRVRETLDTDADLQVKIIGHTSAILVAAPALLDAQGRPATPAALSSLPTLAQRERTGSDRWVLVDSEGNEETFDHEPRLSATTIPILKRAAASGVGVAFLPELVCRDLLDNGQLERVLPEWAGHESTVHLIFTSRRGLLPSVRAVIDFLAAALSTVLSETLPKVA
jgi:DNA-binding transcriptional LysR family regulator